MDPQTCTIILLKQAKPYDISDNEQDLDASLLQTVFGHGNYQVHCIFLQLLTLQL
jgi:hypothetical protein